MIIYQPQTRNFYLETDHTTYAMHLTDTGILTHCYYGTRLPREDLTYALNTYSPNSSARILTDGQWVSPETLLYECPTFGRGDYRTPGILIEGEDGRSVNELIYVSHEILSGKPAFPSMPQADVHTDKLETLAITLEDRIAGYQVILYYTPFPALDILSRRMRILNTASTSITVRSAASGVLELPDGDYELLSLEGAWARERSIERTPLHHGIAEINTRRGSSSHQTSPFAALISPTTDENQGIAYGLALIYSGDFRIRAETDFSDAIRFAIGLNPDTFSWKLAPGAFFDTPEALFSFSSKGLNKLSQSFHGLCRNHLGRSADPDLRHPIIINSWEAMYFDFNEEKMKKFVTDCAGLGIDTVVMDDGWFGHRDTDNSSLGDWFIYKKRLPDGLKGIIDTCHENNMTFGIWFEPEMISRDSDLYRAHPDWCIHTPNRTPIESRNQLVLDMSRPEVVDCIFEQMAELLSAYDISYIKWDMNRQITDNGSDWLEGRQGEFSHRYILGVYDLAARIIRRFPSLFIEGCAGGGGRFDFGMLYYMTQIWTSDDSDAAERLKIQYGTSMVYPPSSMVAHVSACPNHQTGRISPLSTRSNVAQMCSFGYEFDVGKLTAEEKDAIREQIVKHRELESLVNQGTYYRLRSPFITDFCSWMLVSPDQTKAWVLFAYSRVSPHQKTQYLRLTGLAADKQYYIPQLGITRSGTVLCEMGLPINQPGGDYASLTFDLVQAQE